MSSATVGKHNEDLNRAKTPINHTLVHILAGGIRLSQVQWETTINFLPLLHGRRSQLLLSVKLIYFLKFFFGIKVDA